jgi:hypothetical protein
VKILHVDTGSEMRGGQHQAALLIQLLAEAGYQNTLLARHGSPLYRRAFEKGWTVDSAHLFNMFRYSGTADVVHAHDARGHTLAALASRRPFAVSRRVAFPVKQTSLSRWKYRKAARFLAVSCFVKTKLETAGVPAQKIDVVYDAAPTVASGRVDQTAGVVALRSDDPGKCRDLIEQAASLAQVPVLYSDNLVRDFAHAALFVYITREEGLGSAALLAMAMGVPVIASRVGGLAEVLEDRVSGWYTSNEPAEIAASIRQLLAFPETAEQLARAARKRVDERFSAEQMLAGTVECYRRILR